MTFDPTKPVQTREGWKARILATDINDYGGETIAAAITHPGDGAELLRSYYPNGQYYDGDPSGLDLINVPEKHVRWVNFNPAGLASDYLTREDADQYANPTRIACVRVEFEDGEGLA